MPAKFFLDNNVLVYAYSSDDPLKKERCEEFLAEPNVFVSVGILNEFCNVMRRKFKRSGSEIQLAINELTQYVDILNIEVRDLREALRIGERHGFSHYDSLHLASAQRHECDIFVSEDLQDGFNLGKMRVLNPFRARN